MKRSFIIGAFIFLFTGCSSSVMPTISDLKENNKVLSNSLQREMINHPNIPKGTKIEGWNSAISVNSPIRELTLVIFKSKTKNEVGGFFIKKSEIKQFDVQNGCYEMYFIFSDEKENLYKGDDLCIKPNRVGIIHLVRSIRGNYKMRKIN